MIEGKLIDAKATSINLSKFAKAHNGDIEYKDRAKRLRGGLYLTAKCIIRDFIKAYKAEKVKEGYYETSSSLIAEYTEQSRHSIIRHIKKLMDIGVLVDKKEDAYTFGNNYKLKIAADLIAWIEREIKAKPAASADEIADTVFMGRLTKPGFLTSYLDGLLNSS